MTTTDTAFAGAVPTIYDDVLVPVVFEPYAADLAARVRRVARRAVLETAAGTGVVTRALARALPASVRIVATDLNDAMIAIAAARTNAPNVTWQQADAQALPFGDASFDVVVNEFGMMFPPDKPAAYAEAARVLEPGGHFVFNVWGRLEESEVSLVVADAVAQQFPADPPDFFRRVPFGYHDEARIRADLAAGAFSRVDIEAVDCTTRTTAAMAAQGLCMGTPLRHEIETRRPGGLDDVARHAAEALAAHFGRGEIENRMRALVVTAVK